MAVSKVERAAVRESEIEDVFTLYPHLLAKVLNLNCQLSPVSRQMELPSGRLDLLLIGLDKLFLIELKVEPLRDAFLNQVIDYKNDLMGMQAKGELAQGEILSYLLVTAFRPRDEERCEASGIRLVKYLPSGVLRQFFEQVTSISDFATVKPNDYGVWNIHLINRALYQLPEHNTIDKLVKVLPELSSNSLRNHLKFAEQLKLVTKFGSSYLLTDLGLAYLRCRDSALPPDALSEGQTGLLRKIVVGDPFASNTIFGIYSVVETVFNLARNTYPVSAQDMVEHYKYAVGKKFDWATPRSAFLGAKSFINFAIELGLIAKVGDAILLTPSGLRFVLMLQLHKGIKLVDSLQPA